MECLRGKFKRRLLLYSNRPTRITVKRWIFRVESQSVGLKRRRSIRFDFTGLSSTNKNDSRNRRVGFLSRNNSNIAYVEYLPEFFFSFFPLKLLKTAYFLLLFFRIKVKNFLEMTCDFVQKLF